MFLSLSLSLFLFIYFQLGVFKKTKKLIKPRKPKKPNREKKLIKPIKILKKPTGSVRFRFFKPGTEKTEPNREKTEPNQKKTEPNRKKPGQPVWTGFCSKKPNRNRSVWTGFGFLKKKFGLVTFFYKNRTEPKINTPNISFSTTLIKI